VAFPLSFSLLFALYLLQVEKEREKKNPKTQKCQVNILRPNKCFLQLYQIVETHFIGNSGVRKRSSSCQSSLMFSDRLTPLISTTIQLHITHITYIAATSKPSTLSLSLERESITLERRRLVSRPLFDLGYDQFLAIGLRYVVAHTGTERFFYVLLPCIA